MKLTNQQVLMILAAGGLLLWYAKNKEGDAVAAVGNAVNPVNPDNVFYAGVSEIGSTLSGDDEWTLGTWIYNATHKDESFN